MCRIGAPDLHGGSAFELGERPIDHRPIEVATAEEVSTVLTYDPQQTIAGLQKGRVERASAEVVDQPGPGRVVGGPAGGKRRSDGLLDELDLLEPCQARGLTGRRALRQLEER